ncbi:MAG: fatty acid desaturase [Pedosphaera sp.]|nr:fatty acid desaturase [Pedosphaera sp.]
MMLIMPKKEVAHQTSSQSTAPGLGERVYLDPSLIEALHHVEPRHYARLVIFLFLYSATAGAAFLLAQEFHGSAWVYVVNLPLYLLAAASLHGISLFTHEGVHGTLSHRAWWNRALSIACAQPVLQNYSAYKVLHLKHHHHLGQEGDPDHYANYTHWTWLEFAMHWGRLIIGYPAYIVAIPILGYRQGTASARRWILFEVCLLTLLVAGAILLFPWLLLLHGWVIPMLVINTLVNIRGMSQHTFLEHQSDPVLGTRSILTNPVTAFFMCNENYHLEHHLYPGVPWYNLPQLHQKLRDDLTARGAPFIRSYFAFVCEFVVKSLRRSPLGKAKLRG